MNRKTLVIAIVATILVTAGMPAITDTLYCMGVIPLARSIRAEYLSGTALAVILALLILLPSRWRIRVMLRPHACPVCGERIRPQARYCPACGSRVAA